MGIDLYIYMCIYRERERKKNSEQDSGQAKNSFDRAI